MNGVRYEKPSNDLPSFGTGLPKSLLDPDSRYGLARRRKTAIYLDTDHSYEHT